MFLEETRNYNKIIDIDGYYAGARDSILAGFVDSLVNISLP